MMGRPSPPPYPSLKKAAVDQAIKYCKTKKVTDVSVDEFEKLFKLIYKFYNGTTEELGKGVNPEAN